jgi:hypothetical protein
MQEDLLVAAGAEIKSIHEALAIFKAIRLAINHIEENPVRSFQRFMAS